MTVDISQDEGDWPRQKDAAALKSGGDGFKKKRS
jgi:hypothetical protein